MTSRSKAAAHTSTQPDPLLRMPLFNVLTDETLRHVRPDFPGWDVYALKAEFDAWLADNSTRRPEDYQAAFYGFIRQYDARNRHAGSGVPRRS